MGTATRTAPEINNNGDGDGGATRINLNFETANGLLHAAHFFAFAARIAKRALSQQASGGSPTMNKFPDSFNARLQSGVVTAPIPNRYDRVVGKQTVHSHRRAIDAAWRRAR